MNIIGGKLKGKRLASCRSKSIRPAMGLVRKSIFDTLRDFVIDANILDLFAGTGIVGIEAVSRGAKSLTLIDSNRFAVKLIKKNLDLCKISAKVICGELPEIINKLNPEKGKFNLVFIDPPYGQSNLIEEILEKLVSKKLLEPESLISIESEFKSNFILPKDLKLYKERLFGNTKITILRCTL